jgi:hypothetical protein
MNDSAVSYRLPSWLPARAGQPLRPGSVSIWVEAPEGGSSAVPVAFVVVHAGLEAVRGTIRSASGDGWAHVSGIGDRRMPRITDTPSASRLSADLSELLLEKFEELLTDTCWHAAIVGWDQDRSLRPSGSSPRGSTTYCCQ